MEKKIKCCVYLVDGNAKPRTDALSEEYDRFLREKHQLHDLGDDPSLYSSTVNRSEVTWGVCRHNVRQSLKIGDEVFFVCCDKAGGQRWRYYLTGFGCVEKLITHEQIYGDEFLRFTSYFNLLIRPCGGGFEHYEPIPNDLWHDDWKMRISNFRTTQELEKNIKFTGCRSKGIRKKDVSHIVQTVDQGFPFGKNYVIFSKEESSFIIENAIYLAEVVWVKHRHPKIEWQSDDLQALFCRGSETSRNFTSGNYQHPAFNLEPSKAESLKDMISRAQER